MKHPAATERQVSVHEAIEEITDMLSVIIRSFGPIHQAHVHEQIEALIEERRRPVIKSRNETTLT